MKLNIKQVDKLNGRQFELFTGKLFKQLNYKNIQITKATDDHGLDVIATNSNGKRIGIQCKHRYDPKSSTIQFRALEETFTGKTIYHTDKGIILTNGFIDTGTRTYARQLNIKCWDRPVLKELIKLANEKPTNNHRLFINIMKAKNIPMSPSDIYGKITPNPLNLKSIIQIRTWFIILTKIRKSKSKHILISYSKLLKQLNLIKPIKEHKTTKTFITKLIIRLAMPYMYNSKHRLRSITLFNRFRLDKDTNTLNIKASQTLINLINGKPI